MMKLEVVYGVATSFRLGRLRAQATGLFIAAPTIAAGDFKITQDDGVGEDNVDNIPTVDTGTGDLLWTISAAEATAPSANGNYRIMHAADAAGAEWLDRDFEIVTTDHQSAAKPNGVQRQVTPDATPGATSFAVTDATLPSTPLGAGFINCVALIVVSDVATDVTPASTALITSYSKTGDVGTFTYAGGWNRVPTGTAANIRINLIAGAIGSTEKVGSQVDARLLTASAKTVLDLFAAALDQATGQLDPGSWTNPPGLKKNTLIEDFSFPMRDADGALLTGLTVTVQIQKDGGAFAALTGAIAEIGTSGVYQVTTSPAILAAEMNADQVVIKATATGAVATVVQIYTEP